MFKKIVNLRLELALIFIALILACLITSFDKHSRVEQLQLDANDFSNALSLNYFEKKNTLNRYLTTFKDESSESIAKKIYKLEDDVVFIQYLDPQGLVGSIDNTASKGFDLKLSPLSKEDFNQSTNYSPTSLKDGVVFQTVIRNKIAVTSAIEPPAGLSNLNLVIHNCNETNCNSLTGDLVFTAKINSSTQLSISKVNHHLLLESMYSQKTYYAVILGTLILLIIIINYQRSRLNIVQQSKDFERSHDSKLKIKNQYGLSIDLKNGDAKRLSCMLIIEIDNLTSMTNNYGEQALNFILEETRNRLIMLNGDDHIYCNDQHQFTVITSDKSLASIVHEKLSEPVMFREQTLCVTTSIGVALRSNVENHNKFIKNANIALYEAKKVKNTVHIFCEEINQNYQRQIELEHNLTKAIQENQIHLNYQIQVTNDGELHGVEALARWHHPKRGSIRPDVFIGIAESAGLMPALGKLIYSKAFHDVMALSLKIGREIPLSVNVSIREFMLDNFTENLIDIAEAFNFPRHNLTLEITETLDVEDWERFDAVSNGLREHGFKLSLDDFGTGYNSLKLLAEVKLNEVKIDRTFVADLSTSHKYEPIIGSIMNIANSLGLSVVCEGVETEEQLMMLKQLGCKVFQGYLFGRPEPIDGLERSIALLASKTERIQTAKISIVNG